jgi:hypothetical protein
MAGISRVLAWFDPVSLALGHGHGKAIKEVAV